MMEQARVALVHLAAPEEEAAAAAAAEEASKAEVYLVERLHQNGFHCDYKGSSQSEPACSLYPIQPASGL